MGAGPGRKAKQGEDEMANKYLGREAAPVSAALWDKLDATMIEAAKSQLVGRRLLSIEGPFGLGLKFVPLSDMIVSFAGDELLPAGSEEAEEAPDLYMGMEPEVIASSVLPLAMLRHSFALGVRDLAAADRDGLALDLSSMAEAAIACARAEDQLVFHGSDDLGVEGLLDVEGSQALKLGSWSKLGHAADDLIKAVTLLDAGGFHGPYSLALAPSRYNLLYRMYPQGSNTELGHLQSIVTGGIFKAPVLEEGGVLLASGVQFASIVIGQDMAVGFIGPSDGDLEFSITESIALHVRQPGAVCALTA
jgi:uncharacterized linocin/CFP29 family protein